MTVGQHLGVAGHGGPDVPALGVQQDQRTGVGYYTVRIRVTEEERARLGPLRLVPGMPVEAYVRTGARTVLAYLTKPLADQVSKAWRER